MSTQQKAFEVGQNIRIKNLLEGPIIDMEGGRLLVSVTDKWGYQTRQVWVKMMDCELIE